MEEGNRLLGIGQHRSRAPHRLGHELTLPPESGGTGSFKIVMLEGIEVVFVVIAIGAGGRLLLPAAIGALLALVVVVLLGLWLHKPLANVPKNALKFGVGVMLAAFGTFWVGEGIGIEWPGAHWALLTLIAAFPSYRWPWSRSATRRLCARWCARRRFR